MREVKIDICTDPENCDRLHNEEESGSGEVHHYGCECQWCMHVYWTLKH